MAQFSFTGEEWMASLFEAGTNAQQMPRRLITRADFPDAPTESIGLPVPIIYGKMQEVASASSAPILSGSAARGAVFVPEPPAPYPPNIWAMGWGDMPDPPGVATGVSASLIGGGEISAGQIAGDALAVMVVVSTPSGVEGDPHIFNTYATTTVAITGSNNAVRVQWTWPAAATTDWTTKVFIGSDYWNLVSPVNSAQYIEVTYPTNAAVFDRHPATGIEPSPGAAAIVGPPAVAAVTRTIATGANLIEHLATGFYVVSANMSDGETGLSGLAVARSAPYRRKVRIEWLAVSGAVSYNVYRKDQLAGTWTRRWTTTNTYFEDDFLDTGATFIESNVAGPTGPVKLIPCGMRTAVDGSRWHQYLVCGHAVKSIPQIFADGSAVSSAYYGSHLLVPGQAGYSTFFPADAGAQQFRVINGNRYTFVYARGPASDAAYRGELLATANVWGIENHGSGIGTLIENVHEQYLHWLLNFCVRNVGDQNWEVTAPTFPDDPTLQTIDLASFADCAAIGRSRNPPDGYTGATVIGANGEFVSLRDMIARWNVSCDTSCGFSRRTQFFVTMHDDDDAATAAAPLFTEERHIYEGSFATKDLIDRLATRVLYVYARDYTNRTSSNFLRSGVIEDTAAITGFGGTSVIDGGVRESQIREYHMIRKQAVADDISRRYLEIHKGPPRLLSFATSVGVLNYDIGDILRVRHREAIGPIVGGTVTVPIRVESMRYTPGRNIVRVEGLDVSGLFLNRYIVMPVGAMSVIGRVPALNIVGIPVGALRFTGYIPTLRYTLVISPPVGATVFTGHAPTLV